MRVVQLGGARRFGVMAKPAGPRCNLDCTYCYYLGKDRLLGSSGRGPIADEVLEPFIRDTIDGNDHEEVVFEWQGGEPTLLGLDFFRKVVRLQERHCPPDKRALNSLQTNGTLLDEEWCRFLGEHRFLVGLSLDGPRELHDAFRRTRGGESTFDAVVGAAKCLKRWGVEFTTLTVVNRLNATRPLDVYRFITREIGPRVLQFIPCVEPKGFEHVAPGRWEEDRIPRVGTSAARPGTPDSIVTDWSVDPDDFGRFLCEVFDEWHRRDIGRHHVALFESFVGAWAGLPAQVCVFNDLCGKALVMERDGSVYSCDHFVYPEYRLGNVRDVPLVELAFSSRQVAFGHAKSGRLPRRCRECDWLAACYGECPRNRFVRAPDGEPGLNYLCSGLRTFFAHTEDRLGALARRVQRDTAERERRRRS